MRDYEILAFVKEKTGSKDPVADAAGLVSEMVKKEGGELIEQSSLGRKTMGYAIRHQRDAQLVVTQCRFKEDTIARIRRAFRLNADVLTTMIMRKDAKIIATPSQEPRPVKKPSRGRVRTT